MSQEITNIEKDSDVVIKQASSFTIVSQDIYENAGKFLLKIKDLKKEISKTFDPLVKKAHEAHKEATTQRNKHLEPVEKAEYILKTKCKKYENDMAMKAEAERIKAEEEKQKKIDAENKRRQDEADKRRKDEAEVMDVDVKEVEPEKVEEATADDVEVNQPLPTIDKVSGLGIRRVHKWKIVDAGKVPKKYWVIDEQIISAEVRLLKEKTSIPGVEVYYE